MRQLTIRENAEVLRTKTVRALGVTIVISWSMALVQLANATNLPAPIAAPAAEQSAVNRSMAVQ